MMMLRYVAAVIVVAFVIPASADILILEEAKAGNSNTDSDDIWCYYGKDGGSSQTAFGTVSLFVTRPKSYIERIFRASLSTSEMWRTCPKSVNRYPEAPAKLETFSDCVLKRVQGVTSDVATRAVKEACIRSSEAPLPATALSSLMTSQALYWNSPFADGAAGLYVTINNTSGYALTELVIAIVDKKTKALERYIVRSFPEAAPGVALISLPKDQTAWMTIPPGMRRFYTPIRQTTPDRTKWSEAYDWGIVSGKGFLN